MNSEKIADIVFQQILKNEKSLTKVGINNYQIFTNNLKVILGELGESLGYEIATNCSKKYNEGEWLYDLVWYKMNHNFNPPIVKSIDLVFETEISGKQFKHFKVDFDKLLFATSSTKIMLFTKVNKTLQDKILDYVYNTLNNSDDLSINNNIHLIFWDENDTGNFERIIIKKSK